VVGCECEAEQALLAPRGHECRHVKKWLRDNHAVLHDPHDAALLYDELHARQCGMLHKFKR